MSLESGNYITDLVITNPPGSDPKSEGADHLTLIKRCVQQSFPLASGVINITPGAYTINNDTAAIYWANTVNNRYWRQAISGSPTAPLFGLAYYNGTTTTTAMIGNSDGSLDIRGTTTSDTAPAGYVGENIESIVATGSAIPLTSGVYANITNITLTPGDWDVYGVTSSTLGSGTSMTQQISTISSTSGGTNSSAWAIQTGAAHVPGSNGCALNIAPHRISTATNITMYLVSRATFTVSTFAVYGRISARRVR
jgi:hypothetical protein